MEATTLTFPASMRARRSFTECLSDWRRKRCARPPVLQQIPISPKARLPAATDPDALKHFVDELILRLRAEVFARERRD